MLANNETGERFEMPRREHANDLIFTDATAAMGHMDIDVKRLNVDMLAAGGHKFGAPCGIGFLYARHGIEVHRSGTPPVALACSMASALEWQTEHMVLNTETVSQKRNDLEWLLTNRFGGERILINTPPKNRLPHILNVSFDGVDGKALALMLSHCGVMVSAGAACTSGDNAPSHVLMAMYHDEARARSAIRISLSHENTVSECEQAAKIIAECVEQLRAIS
jgi:cysteine desulfurase